MKSLLFYSVFMLLLALSFTAVAQQKQQVAVGPDYSIQNHVLNKDTLDTSARAFISNIYYDTVVITKAEIFLDGSLSPYFLDCTTIPISTLLSGTTYEINDTLQFDRPKTISFIGLYQVPSSVSVGQKVHFSIKLYCKHLAAKDTFSTEIASLQTVYWKSDTIANTGIFQSELENEKISIFPNPTSGKFIVYVSLPKQKNEIAIYDILGRPIYCTTIYTEKTEIDLTSQPKGTYFLELRSESGIFNKKVVIE